jgi:hypothetical protein
VADYNVGAWALDVARRTGVRSAAIWPASAAVLASLLSIDKLIQDKIIDPQDGTHIINILKYIVYINTYIC